MALHSEVMDVDQVTGIRRLIHYDDVEDTLIAENVHEVTDILEANKFLMNEYDGVHFKEDTARVAQIPMPLFYELKAQGIVDDPKLFKAWLNDRDNRAFRTRPGRI